MNELHEEDLKEGYYDWDLLRRILGYMRPYALWISVSLLLILVVSILNLAGPYLTKIAVDDYIQVSNYAGLDGVALTYLVVLLAAFVLQFAQTMLMQFVGQKVMYDLRTQVFAHLHKMSFRYFDRNPIGKMMTRVVNDVEVLNEMLTSGLILIFSDLFTLAGVFVVLFVLDWRLTLAVCLVFPFLVMATQAYRTRARDALRKSRAHSSLLNSYLEENLSGMATVQTFNRMEKNYRRFEQINENKLREDLRSNHYNSLYMPSIDVFSAVGIGLAIWYGGGRIVQDEIQLGVLIAFIQYLNKFFEPIRDLAEKFNIIQTAMTSSERIFELLDVPVEQPDLHSLSSPQVAKKLRGRVEFKNVWFAYKDEDYILKDLSFTLEEGESLAIVGHTGSGKSSIINALCRFYDIQRGSILVDGTSSASMDKHVLRRNIALVQQDVFLFSGNILDNIRLGDESLTLEDAQSLAKAANAHNFIDDLPDKYHQDVREGASLLSLGQKQLLSFTRALAADSSILVLDEATSSVDSETEQNIQDAVRELIKGRTSIVIAHRLSTLKHVDKVLVLRNGRVQEFGSREELLRKKGVFYRLYRMQEDILKT